jgi:hypothetical protein
MTITKIAAREKACDFVGEFADNPDCLRIIHFFIMHPYARFNRLAIPHSQNANGCQSSLGKCLRGLVDQGFIKECSENGLPLYYLSRDDMVISLAIEMANLDWRDWNVLTNPKKC